MKITTIQIIRRDNTETKLKALVNIVLDDMIAIHDIKVIDNGEVYFLAMPSRSTKAGSFKDIVHPINQDVRKVFEELILGAYKKSIDNNFSYLELRLSQESDVSLLQQSFEMFEIVNSTLSSAFADDSNMPKEFQEKKPLHSSSKSNGSEIDAELLKWLES